MTDKKLYLTRAQLISELGRCLGCKSKPCMNACPVNCNPQEFIAKAKANDFAGAVETITRNNPMGQTCGLICPDKFCMQACTRAGIDFPINIPRVQATILEKYRTAESAAHPKLPANGKKVAVIGAGPAGIAATAELSRLGYRITLFESFEKIGGALNLIPDKRLPFEVIAKDWSFIDDPDMIELRLNTPVNNPAALLEQDFDGVIVATGEPEGINLGIDGEEHAVSYLDYLRHPEHYAARGNIAVIGGGAVATDCALTAVNNGAENVEMFVRRRVSDMRVTGEERKSLLDAGVDLTTMTKIKKIGATEITSPYIPPKTVLIAANWKKFPTPPSPGPAFPWSSKPSAAPLPVSRTPTASSTPATANTAAPPLSKRWLREKLRPAAWTKN